MQGGKKIAEGGYGCVYYPALNKDGNENNDESIITKLMEYNDSAKNEIEIGKTITIINGYKNHFSPVIANSFLNKNIIQKDIFKNCSVIDTKNIIKQFILLKMDYIKGDDFLNYVLKNNEKLIVKNIINSYTHLLRSILLLEDYSIIHFDIKGDNILFNNIKQIPIIIDFGISIPFKEMKNRNNINDYKKYFFGYFPEYHIWPLEIHYLCYLLHVHENPDKDNIISIIDDYIKQNPALNENMSPSFLKKYKNACSDYLMSINNNKDIYQKINAVINYWYTWDNYGLSIMYLKFLRYMNVEGYKDNNFIIFLSQILLKNIHPNPNKRLTTTQTWQSFNQFLYKLEVNNIITFEEITEEYIKNRDKINKEVFKNKTNIRLITKKVINKKNS
jgi:serine/threonine protein kinase